LSAAFGLFALATGVLVMAGLNDHLGKADAALVLGSKVEPNGTPSARLQARLDRALELYRAGYFSTIIVSGGMGREGFDEAKVMKDYLVAHGVPPDQLIVDSDGVTTFASARNTARMAHERNFHSVLVVSQYFHVPRSRLALERFGISSVYSAHAHYFEWRDVYSAPRELLGYLRYFFRHYDPVN
jgi:vancomycin permeability regulator SanA